MIGDVSGGFSMGSYSDEQISYLFQSVPKYAYIKMDITNKIKSGELAVGDKIETESSLCSSYGCSRLTVRKALEDLLHEGFIYKVQGLGSFVKERIPQKQNLEGINSCTALIKAQNKIPTKKIITSTLSEGSEEIRRKLRLNPGDPLFFYSRIYYADGLPVIYGCSYYNAQHIPGIEKIDFSDISIVAVLKERYGLELKCSNRELKAVLSDPHASLLLGTPENYPLLQVTDLKTAMIQNSEIPIEYYTFQYVTDRIRYSPEIT